MGFPKSKKLIIPFISVLALALVLCSPDTTKALSYYAPLSDSTNPFTFQSLYYPPFFPPTISFSSPGRLDYNSMAGYNRGYYASMGGWSDPYNWNNTSFVTQVNDQNGEVNFDISQWTLLQNRWERGINGHVTDIIAREGFTSFEPFDSSLGMLNNVTVNFNWTLDTWLTLSLLDDRFIGYNAEGTATGSTFLSWGIGGPSYFGPTLTSNSDTSWQTAWSGGFGGLLDSLNSGAWGGAPNIYDALHCLLYPEDCVYEPVQLSELWSITTSESLNVSVTLTPEEYYSCLGSLDYLPISLLSFNNHNFWYEEDDVYDESVYSSIAKGSLFVEYDYLPTEPVAGPVPEPTTLLLVGSGLIGLAGFRKKFRKKSSNT